MSESFDPYYKWLGIPPKDQPPNHYRLLAIELYEADAEVIDAAANRLMSFVQDFATGPQVAHSQKLLNELAAARVCLLNRSTKAAYDAQLRARLAPKPRRLPIAAPLSPPQPPPPTSHLKVARPLPPAAPPPAPPPRGNSHPHPPVVAGPLESPPAVDEPLIRIEPDDASGVYHRGASGSRKPPSSHSGKTAAKKPARPPRDPFHVAIMAVGSLGVLVIVVIGLLMALGGPPENPDAANQRPADPGTTAASTARPPLPASPDGVASASVPGTRPDSPDAEEAIKVLCQRGGDGLFADVAINGRTIGPFLLDTGCGYTVVDQALAEQLELPAAGTTTVGSPWGQAEFPVCQVRSLSMGRAEFADVRAVSVDLTSWSESLGVRIAGVVGGDVWSRGPFTIDLPNAMLTFFPAAGFTPPDEVAAVDLTLTSGQPHALGWTDPSHLGSLLLATGAQCGFYAESPLPQPDGEAASAASLQVQGLQGSAAVGQVSVTLGLFDQVHEPLWALVPEASGATPDEAAPDDAPRLGIVGAPVLRHYRLTFDYAAARLWPEYVETPDESADRGALRLTRLLRAAQSGSAERLRVELAAGLSLEATDLAGKTSLRLAAERGYGELVGQLIAAGAKVGTTDRLGQTPLMAACQFASLETVDALLKAGANPNTQASGGLGAMHVAVRQGRTDVVESLLRHKVDVAMANRAGVTPLMVAAWQGDLEIVRLLLKNKAPWQDKTSKGANAVQIARKYEQVEVAEAIREHIRANAKPAPKPQKNRSPQNTSPRPPPPDATIDDEFVLGGATVVVAASARKGP